MNAHLATYIGNKMCPSGIALLCGWGFLGYHNATSHFRQRDNISVRLFVCGLWISQASELVLNRQCFG